MSEAWMQGSKFQIQHAVRLHSGHCEMSFELGLQHSLERSGHADMIGHMRGFYTEAEQAAYGLGLLFGWFMRTYGGVA